MEKIAIIGIGKMGLCFALNLEKAGYNVLGIDQDERYIGQINEKSLLSNEPGVTAMLQNCNHLVAAVSLSLLTDFAPSLIFIMVNTPDSPSAGYDHSQLDKVLADLMQLPFAATVPDIVISCTTIPGYCNSKITPLREKGLQINYSPQFIAQGTIIRDQQYPDQILIGQANDIAGEKIEAVYQRVCRNQPAVSRMSCLSAEIAKLATNCFLTLKIAFSNAIGDLAVSMGGEPNLILEAIGADSRIGKKFLTYGFGFGGPCLSRDNRALATIAAVNGHQLALSMASDHSNKQHLDFQFERVMENHLPGDEIIFQTVTYKANTFLLDESQQLALALKLARAGRKVVIYERDEVLTILRSKYGGLFEYREHLPVAST